MKFIQKVLSAFDKDIIMYSNYMWTDCQNAKSFFAENGLNLKVKDISNEDIREEMKGKFNRVMVPVIIIKGNVFIGFDDNKDEIKKLIGK